MEIRLVNFICIMPKRSGAHVIRRYTLQVLSRLSKCLVVLALAGSIGLPWMLLQTVAWTTMLANNLRTDSFSEAVTKTFDGQHPCPLCKAISAGKKSEKRSAALSTVLKMEFPPVSERFVFISPPPVSAFSPAGLFAAALSAKPPVPPPRGFFV